MKNEILNLYQDYKRGGIGRREFLKKLALIAGGTAAAVALLPLIEKTAVSAEIIPPDDPRLETEKVTYPGETGDIKSYLARPKGAERLPAVIVIHENRGLQPHIRDVTRRVALEGFLALAPDALSPLGGTTDNSDEDRSKMGQLDGEKTIKDFASAVDYLKTHPLSTGKVGCTGFCWGGGITNQVAVHAPDLKAAVPYYGRQPEAEDVPKIKASILCHYAELDERINAGIPAFEEAMKQAGIDHRIFVYKGAAHAFNNDTSTRYHEEAAKLAFERTIAFFKEKLNE
ncbi:MAG: dienelactone hydrolase family protein [Acidobacteria bacterium]|nr:dienelactone hydrolase family protein [Acidobacteriota bacterium]